MSYRFQLDYRDWEARANYDQNKGTWTVIIFDEAQQPHYGLKGISRNTEQEAITRARQVFTQMYLNKDQEKNRLSGAAVGGAILGASLGGPLGAAVGGVIGLALGKGANNSERDELREATEEEVEPNE